MTNQNPSWNLHERLEKYPGYRGMHVSTFANRQVVEYNPEVAISDFVNTAYAIRCEYDEQEDATVKLVELLQDSQASKIEALIFGMWHGEMYAHSSKLVVDALIAAKDKLINLKALFIGDISYDESEISWIIQSDISPILEAYPKLELLQIRGGDSLEFSPFVRHDNLKALIIETGGLSSATIAQICALDLPQLQHLELWLGSDSYGGDSTIENLNPILVNPVFPNLIYLGLRNSQYSDDIAKVVINSPLINSIKILDLSLGTLSDADAEVLLNCSAVRKLNILNLSENFLSEKMRASVQVKQDDMEVRIITDGQKKAEEDYDDEVYRYCSVAE
ncbi:STM4015 family protein [Tolypothrix sp. VBCCA 56010]|uniref:STM4015 family protein n=1 Tax=Tolypothrix sp. VBCCA 56010 TaxID=3137731 RepID=UPI003D7C4F7F